MSKRIAWPVLAFVLLTAVGCAAETLPAPDPTVETVVVDRPTTAAQEEDTASGEPPAEATAADTATAEALKKILESDLLETPTQIPSLTPILEEVIQLQPQSSKLEPQAMRHINHAKADLAQRLSSDLSGADLSGADLSVILLVAYEEVTWRDGSLGCPQPGMMYTQALVDGYLIQLQVDGQTYNYHGADGREPFLCANNSGATQSPDPDLRGGELSTPPVQKE